MTPLSYPVDDARYSVALDRIVIASQTNNTLHVYDPRTNEDTPIQLPAGLPQVPAGEYGGLYLGLSPDGLKAVVADGSWVVYVDLVTASVLGQWNESPNPQFQFLFQGVAVGNDGYAYAYANAGYSLLSVNLSTGALSGTAHVSYANYYYSLLSASPDGTTLYALDGAPQSDGWLWSARPMGGQFGGVSRSTMPTCGTPWVSRDGTRIFSGCGPTFGTAVGTQDGGALPAGPVLQVAPAQPETSDGGDEPYADPPIFWLDDPSNGSPVAAVGMDPNAPNQHSGAVALALYNPSTLALESTVAAPLIPYGGVSHPSVPAYVFYDASGANRYELVAAGEGASAVWAVASF
ncbi:MAG TPA: hypothetical protein VGL81_07165 [Polyangiaceae bacterium]